MNQVNQPSSSVPEMKAWVLKLTLWGSCIHQGTFLCIYGTIHTWHHWGHLSGNINRLKYELIQGYLIKARLKLHVLKDMTLSEVVRVKYIFWMERRWKESKINIIYGGFWFVSSLINDFSREEAVNIWWNHKKQTYLVFFSALTHGGYLHTEQTFSTTLQLTKFRWIKVDQVQ